MASRSQYREMTKEELEMTDTVSPTTQFHPYSRPDATPVSEREEHGIPAMLKKVGIDSNRMRNMTEKCRSWGRSHPGRLLGGMDIAVIAAGMLRGRMHKRPAPAV